VAICGVIISIFSVYVYFNTVNIRKDAFYDRLMQRVDLSVQLLNKSYISGSDSINQSEHDKKWSKDHEEEIVVYKSTKEFFYINEYKPAQFDYSKILRQLDQSLEVEMKTGERQYVGCRKLIGKQYVKIIVSGVDIIGRKLFKDLRITLLTACLASLLLIVLSGLFFTRNIFAPINKIINFTEKMSGSGLHLRVPIPSRAKGELVKLASTINDSLSRIETAFYVQKSFVDHASHELKTPITALTGELELALMKDRTNEDYRKLISASLEDARRLSALVDQLLLLAQTTAIQTLPSKQVLRVDELVLDFLERISQKFKQNKIEFSLDDFGIDDNMFQVEGNEQLLSVAIGNILDNAIKYNSEGSSVHFGLSRADGFVNIRIEDHGIGISDLEMKNIFEPFYRSEKVQKKEGFGIGLPLARRIIELHNGKMEIQSKDGIGTTVLINLIAANIPGEKALNTSPQ
jgi:signal transduction histidine kinase